MPKPKLFERLFVSILVTGLFMLGMYLASKEESTSYPMEAYFMDVGQGDAELIKIGKDIETLIDGGPDSRLNEEIDKIISPFDTTIEAIIISHPHADHIGGLISLLERKVVNKIYLFDDDYSSPDVLELKRLIMEKNIPVEKLTKSQEIDFYGLNLKIHWPETEFESSDANEKSIAFTARYAKCKLLFLGDLSSKTQGRFLDELEEVNILKVSHHGSKYGTDDMLIEKVSPDFAVIEVGENNKYGQPAPSVVNKLANIRTLRTDGNGTVKFGCDGENTLLLN